MRDAAPTAYLVMSHRLPGLLLRLVTRLREGSPRALIAVHHDGSLTGGERGALEAQGARLVEPAVHVTWGSYSQLEAQLASLRWLLAAGEFAWVVLLSGQDYPIRPVPEIERSLGAAEVDAFVEARHVPPPPLRRGAADEFARRYHYRWYRLPRAGGARLAALAGRADPFLQARALPTGSWAGLPARRSPFRAGLRCHRGSDWFTLNRRAAEAVDAFARSRPDVLRHYRRTLLPTESFAQTALANDAALRLSGDFRRFMRWDAPAAAHPRVLRQDDLESMLASGSDFARKFDPGVDAGVLDELDRRVHAGRPGASGP